tara:strand:+ start:145 stop:351 length:207 start_codon:yes stop_codon:yes gene_type:complete
MLVLIVAIILFLLLVMSPEVIMSPESGNFLPKVARKWHKCGKDLPLKKGIDSNQKYFRKKMFFLKIYA